jgi:hypothetical protein
MIFSLFQIPENIGKKENGRTVFALIVPKNQKCSMFFGLSLFKKPNIP